MLREIMDTYPYRYAWQIGKQEALVVSCFPNTRTQGVSKKSFLYKFQSSIFGYKY